MTKVTLTASPTSGPAPLSVSFPCTAKAVIHYEDEVCITQTEEEGSVENRTPHYKEESITPTCPADCTLEAVSTYSFTATATHGGVTGSATATVTVQLCPVCQARYQQIWIKSIEKAILEDEARTILTHLQAIYNIRAEINEKELLRDRLIWLQGVIGAIPGGGTIYAWILLILDRLGIEVGHIGAKIEELRGEIRQLERNIAEIEINNLGMTADAAEQRVDELMTQIDQLGTEIEDLYSAIEYCCGIDLR